MGLHLSNIQAVIPLPLIPPLPLIIIIIISFSLSLSIRASFVIGLCAVKSARK
jgi:hypothetical protein